MVPGALASNPANGINNIALNPQSSAGLDAKTVLQKVDVLLQQNDLKTPSTQALLYQLGNQCENLEWKEIIHAILKNLSSGIGAGPATINPTTGKPYPSPRNLLLKLRKLLQDDIDIQGQHMEKQPVTAQQKKKKRDSRGNPFRVLMGKVGKLLDHGLEKREIVRYLSKEKYWNESIIEKAVKIVKEYNKKKHKKMHKKSFNYCNFNKNAGKDLAIYNFEPDFTKRTLGELLSRYEWLQSMDKFGPKEIHSEGRTAFDKEGVKSELRKIKAELTARGYGDI